MFDRPFDFDPNRYLGSDDPNKAQIDPRKLVFGYGRRVCPGASAAYPMHIHIHYYTQGAHFAELSIYLSITGILAMFNIRKQNQDGVEITPKFEFTTGITRFLICILSFNLC